MKTERLTEHATALGRVGAKSRWSGTTEAERKRIMSLVRAAKKKRDPKSAQAEKTGRKRDRR